MKNLIETTWVKCSFIILVTSTILLSSSVQLKSQCVDCSNTSTPGLNASAIGNGNTASGNYSFVGGFNSSAEGTASFAFGNRVIAAGASSLALGRFVRTNTSPAIVIGTGFDIDNPLINNVPNSFMVGFNSNLPTLTVSDAWGKNLTGKIGIGNITNPQAKLHILADDNEDASLLLEPSNPKMYMANLQLLDANSGLTVGARSGLELFTDLGNMQFAADVFNFAGTQVNMPALRINNAYSLPTTIGKPGEFLSADGTWAAPSGGGGGGDNYWLPSGNNIYYGNAVGIGMEPKERLSIDSPYGRPIHFHIGGSQGINSNAWYDATNTVTKRSEAGPAYQISFSESNMAFKSAESGSAGSTVNWNEAMVITKEGKIGIGTQTTNSLLGVRGIASGIHPIVHIENTTNQVNVQNVALKVIGGRAIGTPGTYVPAIAIHAIAGETNKGNPKSYALYAEACSDGSPYSYAAYFNGNVGVGTLNPDYMLTVAGGIHAREINVTIDAGADFVFNGDYQLKNLFELEAFIHKNQRLPDIPSEKEMLENGIELGDMQIKLLQKIEELTLYIISMQKEIEELKNNNP
ncbi:MAG: hypothetical protein M0Q90_08990 [Bacteroidales bacterium]|nr:hypothetical protein [Bacteroidales bacterium]